MRRFTGPPHLSQEARAGSVMRCSTSKVPQLVQLYSYVGMPRSVTTGCGPSRAPRPGSLSLLHHPDRELAQRRTDHPARAGHQIVEHAARSQRHRAGSERDAQLVAGGGRLQNELASALHAEVRTVRVRMLAPAGLLRPLEVDAVHQQLIGLHRVEHGGLVVRIARISYEIYALHEVSSEPGGGGRRCLAVEELGDSPAHDHED